MMRAEESESRDFGTPQDIFMTWPRTSRVDDVPLASGAAFSSLRAHESSWTESRTRLRTGLHHHAFVVPILESGTMHGGGRNRDVGATAHMHKIGVPLDWDNPQEEDHGLIYGAYSIIAAYDSIA